MPQLFDESSVGKTLPLKQGAAWPTMALPLVEDRQGFSFVLRLGAGTPHLLPSYWWIEHKWLCRLGCTYGHRLAGSRRESPVAALWLLLFVLLL